LHGWLEIFHPLRDKLQRKLHRVSAPLTRLFRLYFCLQMTVLNLAYLGLMNKFKGDFKFSMFMIPQLVQGYMKQLDLRLGNRSATLLFLGNTSLNSSSLKAYPVFGHWIRSSPFGQVVLDLKRQGRKNYNASEMQGLYNVLINASLLFPPSGFNASSADYISKPGNGLLSYLGYYVKNKTITSQMFNISQKTMDAQAEQVRLRMNDLLCADKLGCFLVNDTETAQALLLFISTHIPACAMAFIDSYKYGIVVTRPQKELVLGYFMAKLPLPPTFPNGVPVAGALTNHMSVDDARARGKTVLMYTCSTEKKELANTWAGTS
jgi:hypothetical protein